MQEAETRLGKVSESFDMAMKRLSSGKGNLVKRVVEIRELGAKVKRELPSDITDGAHEENA